MRRNRTLLIFAVAVLLVAAGVAFATWRARTQRPGEPFLGMQAEQTRWPLTGRAAPDEQAIGQRVVLVKIENSRAARPQSRLADADVVYETLTEAGITRFAAIFHSKAPSGVGPVRSARLSDVYLVPQYRALFARAGANTIVENRIEDADIDDMNQFTNPGPYHRSTARQAPHNLYVDIERLRKVAAERGFPSELDPPELAFGPAPSSGGTTDTAFTIPFAANNRVTWRWDAGARRYERSINGQPHQDAGADRPYSAQNVVVMFARVTQTEQRDVRGSATFDIQLAGSGDVDVFRDGRRFGGTWTAGADGPPRFRSDTGEELELAAGQTWVEVVPMGFAIGVE